MLFLRSEAAFFENYRKNAFSAIRGGVFRQSQENSFFSEDQGSLFSDDQRDMWSAFLCCFYCGFGEIAFSKAK
jgi:hypothetical protein